MIEVEDVDVGVIMDRMTVDGHFKYGQIECILRTSDMFSITEEDSIKVMSVFEGIGIKKHLDLVVNYNIVEFYGEKIRYYLEYDDTICMAGSSMAIYEAPLNRAASHGVLYCRYGDKLISHTIEDNALDAIRKYVHDNVR
jgi:hypothetical protein